MNERAVRVLAIDDDPGDLQILETYLRRVEDWQLDFRSARSGPEGLARLEEFEADVVIVDYRLHDADGIELVPTLKDVRPVPIIVVSSQGDEAVAVRAINAGASDYLPKGVLSTPSLERSISNALEKADLLSDLERKNAELVRANEDLCERNRQIESFHHILSHELRTPLAAVREFVSLVLDGVAGETTEDQTRYLEIACESCDQMRMLLDDILDATRLDTGKLRIDPGPRNLGPVVEHVIAGMESRAEEAGVVLRSFVSHELPPVTVDESRLAQVVGNLISNAIKFTPPGGTVDVLAHVPEDRQMMTVEVRDEGCGIPPEHAGHIFERLYQVPGSMPRESGGLGLGLAICKQIVELHGGKMSVHSEPGVGSSFYFTLPIARQESSLAG